MALLEKRAELAAVEQSWAMWLGVVQFGLAGDGRLIDPVGCEALDKDVERGLLTCGHEEGLVGLGPSCHRHVDVADISWPLREQ